MVKVKKLYNIGSIEGIVQWQAVNKKSQVTICEELSDKPIKCISNDKKINDLLKKSIDKRISVRGKIFYNKDGIPQRINVQELRFLGENPLPTWEDVRGILND